MSGALAAAALLAIALALAHSWLGELYIVGPLLRRPDLPRLFGSDRFTRQTVRYAWHLTTVAWVGIAAMLLVLGGALPPIPVGGALLLVVAATFAASAVLAIVLTRGRHLSWIVFLAISALCWWTVT